MCVMWYYLIYIVNPLASGPSSTSCLELNWILLLLVSGDCCQERDGFFWLAKRQWVEEWIWSTPTLAQVLFIFWSKLIGKFAAVFRVFTILSDLVPKFVDSAATTRGEAAAGPGTKLVSTLHSGITGLQKCKIRYTYVCALILLETLLSGISSI